MTTNLIGSCLRPAASVNLLNLVLAATAILVAITWAHIRQVLLTIAFIAALIFAARAVTQFRYESIGSHGA